MINKNNFDNHDLLLQEWEARYESQSEAVKRELDILDDQPIPFIKIKRSYKMPEKGDLFVLQPRKGIYFYGLVFNSHVKNAYGDECIIVAIFKSKTRTLDANSFCLDYSELMLEPIMTGRIFWTCGLFFNVGHIEDLGTLPSYGLYNMFKTHPWWDEYDNPLLERPQWLTAGITTTIGIPYRVNQELIIDKTLLEFSDD